MIDVLKIPELGRLEIVEVYEYYDQPVLYTCKNDVGHFYLVVAADEDDQYLTWLCAAVSTGRLNLIRSGAIDLHDAFADPENTHIVQVKVPYSEHASVQVDFVQSNLIPADILPTPCERLDLEIHTLPELRNSEEIARARKQEILNLTLNFAGGFRTEASIAPLSKILGGFQETINTVGMVCGNENQVTENIRSNMEVSLLAIGAGSFDMQLASTKIVDLLDRSDFGDAIEKFLKLLNAANNHDQLKALLDQLTSRVARSYTQFLKALNESVIDTRFTWKSPNPDRGGSAFLSKVQIQKVIEILERFQEEEPIIFNITGKLTGVFLSNKTFEIETTDKPYKGKIADEAIETVQDATLSQIYTAEIQEITERSETTGETKTKYELLSLRR